ncbi:MAG TPA: hypothetical protein VFG50_07540 [Rhodothermales bacterium]|nr:hypothetical protein [Rhodothermales bacterium]
MAATDEKDEKLPPDFKPKIATDPEAQPQLGGEKRIVAPDPEKVREAERKREREKGHPDADAGASPVNQE